MKTNYLIFKVLSLSFFLTCIGFAQDINVHNCIGKSRSEVIKKYGKPVHQDDSNPSMICMFYKSNSNSMIFVSDADGIYQAEASASYNNEKAARSVLDDFISGSLSNGFTVDTVTTSDFNLNKTGVKVDLQMAENKLSKKFDIRVKANRSNY
jgi:hypothetical protein